MESSQPTGTLEKVSNRYGEETNTIQGETNTIEKGVETQEVQITTLGNLEHSNQQETKISEETKREESEDIYFEEMTSYELYEQLLIIKYLFNNRVHINEALENERKDQVFGFIRKMKNSYLIEILKGSEHDIFTERVLNTNQIINIINNSFEDLKC